MLTIVTLVWLVCAIIGMYGFYLEFNQVTLGDVVISVLCAPFAGLFGLFAILTAHDFVLISRK